MASHLGRRKFLVTLGGAAAAWPLPVRAQQPAMAVVGFVRDGTFDVSDVRVTAFRRDLKEAGNSSDALVPHSSRGGSPPMILSAAEQQLVHIIRAGRGRNVTLTVRVRDRRYSVRLASHDDGPGTGIGFGDSFDAACGASPRYGRAQ
jgi:hypothetical protein